MKTNTKKKLLSGIAVLAVSASALFGTVALVSRNNGNNYVPGVSNLSKGVISTALGEAQQRAVEGAKTYYVSPNGSGTDYTKENPGNLETLLHTDGNANATLQAGDTVYLTATASDYTYVPAVRDITVEGSTYASAKIVLKASGTYDKYIVITADPDAEAKPVIDFKNQTFDSRNRGIEMTGNYIYWQGIDVMGAGDNGIYVSGSFNTIEDCEFSFNRDTGLQIGRSSSGQANINTWPQYNLIKNCTSHNNYDNETYGENADGFAAKLTIGYGNVFDGCIAYRNSDDGWDLYAKQDSGNIGSVVIYNCVAFENGYIETTINEFNEHFPKTSITDETKLETSNGTSYSTMNGDGNGFKLGGESMKMDVNMYNCLSFNNRLHGFTDNSNPGVLKLSHITGVDNGRAAGQDPSDTTTYGQIIDKSYTDDSSKYSGDIDIARHNFSYNVLDHALSIRGQLPTNVADDAYRGAVSDSLLVTNGSKQYIVEGSLDADSNSGIYGTETTKLDSSIFQKVAITKAVGAESVTYTYLLSGKDSIHNEKSIDELLRNPDRSINMQGYYQVNEGQAQVNGETVGADFTGATMDAYTHPTVDKLNEYEGVENETKARLEKAKELLVLPLDDDHVYQDFEVPALLGYITIEWTSSADEFLHVGPASDPTDALAAPSGTSFHTVIVNRQPDEDKQVTLTAKLTMGTDFVEKTFNLVIVKNEYKLGELVVTGSDGSVINDGAVMVLDQYAIFADPVVTVSNGYDYNGKLLPKDKYTLETKYEFQSNANAPKIVVAGFTPSHPGVFTITHTATLVSDNSTVSMSYVVYTASPNAVVDFVGDGRVNLTPTGYTIAGSMSSATGYIYSISSATPLDVTAANIKTISGVAAHSFRGASISEQFENGNSAAYHIYYAFTNVNGEVTSEVYHKEIGLVEITTAEQFRTIAGGGKIGSEVPANTIYSLKNDIDFATNGLTVTGGSQGANYDNWAEQGDKTPAFEGLLNGNGHAIKNVIVNSNKNNSETVNDVNVSMGLFADVKNGTIMNIKFENITIESGTQSTGIVCNSHGGYFYNIAMKNIKVSGNQRVAALIGLVNETEEIPLYIERVSLDNSEIDVQNKSDYLAESAQGKNSNPAIYATNQRVGGFVGLVQCSDAKDAVGAQIYITNCYVHADFKAGQIVSGFVAEFEDQKVVATGECGYLLEIRYSVYHGTLVGSTSSHRVGGFIGYHKGGGVSPLVYRCASLIDAIYDNNVDVTKVPQKNASAIIGQQANIGERVERCLVVNNNIYDAENHQAEYVDDFDKLATADYVDYFFKTLGLDNTIWQVYKNAGNTALVAPYIGLIFKV